MDPDCPESTVSSVPQTSFRLGTGSIFRIRNRRVIAPRRKSAKGFNRATLPRNKKSHRAKPKATAAHFRPPRHSAPAPDSEREAQWNIRPGCAETLSDRLAQNGRSGELLLPHANRSLPATYRKIAQRIKRRAGVTRTQVIHQLGTPPPQSSRSLLLARLPAGHSTVSSVRLFPRALAFLARSATPRFSRRLSGEHTA